MKRIVLLLFMSSITLLSYSQDKHRGILFDNEKLLIEKMVTYPSWTRLERSWEYVAFDNKTNYPLRVHFEVSFRFIRYHDTPVDQRKEETIIIKPQGSHIFATYEFGNTDWIEESNIMITDFKLIDYSVKKEEYEVPW